MKDFHKWIKDTGGTQRVADLVGVTRRTVFYWKSRDAIPDLRSALEIERLTNGRITPKKLYAATRRKNKK